MIQNFEFEELDLKGAYLIKPFIAWDNRGHFIKDYAKEVFAQNEIKYDLKEIFYSTSKKGTIRGMHFQTGKQQSKLVRCISGKIFDVIIDLRIDSLTYKEWCGFMLDADNHNSLYIPKGFAHGFLAIEESIVSYKCDEEFYSTGDSGIKWDDFDIGIEWPLDLIGSKDMIIISDKDKNLQTFEEFNKKR